MLNLIGFKTWADSVSLSRTIFSTRQHCWFVRLTDINTHSSSYAVYLFARYKNVFEIKRKSCRKFRMWKPEGKYVIKVVLVCFYPLHRRLIHTALQRLSIDPGCQSLLLCSFIMGEWGCSPHTGVNSATQT